ncbi:N-acetylmuramic acid 6-phosphate etherase [Salisediminibacterium selenitireducens]|uniref:N-acetylmuramic acid 6-phosphate etherase n=1 Tax=Bacillus selenitireducens (strain ATCC 700615 / DSM 15326 / MLS10) TaxID=439292 RepID=D6XVW4_BACIE|nr:glucokinase regulatory-like protein [[Bacillus] selenitireducens MLS10]
MTINLSDLTTERRNERTKHIDQLSSFEILSMINEEDHLIAESVKKEMKAINNVVEVVCERFKKGGKLVYIGAGTSGRIGVLDAAEAPPTFRTDPEMIQALIAGGDQAMFHAIEGAEDSKEQAKQDLERLNLSKDDVIIAIAASGRTPYAKGAVEYGNEINAVTVGLSCNKGSELSALAQLAIEVEVGPEVITGSTRMKAATAQKLVLNMISTSSMILIGKIFENLMVDLKASNHKLQERAKSITSAITGCSEEEVEQTLIKADFEVKPAIVMLKTGVSLVEAKEKLKQHRGFVRKAIESQSK